METAPGTIDWLSSGAIGKEPCPVCQTNGDKAAILAVASLAPGHADLLLLACPDCGSHFFDDRTPFQYEDPGELQWSNDFYVEQGAAIDLLIEPLTRVTRPPGTRCLELGCGYGFALDAASRVLGWQAVGVDPSPLARAGRRDLGVEIRPIYADATTELGGKFDIVYASEVIEHLGYPGQFIETCRAHLAAAGVLIITTPDAASIDRATPSGTLVPLLSPGHHLVLFSRSGLERLLGAAGFAHLVVEERQHGLVAFASDRPFNLTADREHARSVYRRYLEQALIGRPPGTPLWIGLGARLVKELTNGGHYEAALASFETLAAGLRDCLDLDVRHPLPTTFDAACLGNQTRKAAPWCLAGLYLSQGMVAVNHLGDHAAGVSHFDEAARIARLFMIVYARIGIADGETAEIEHVAVRLAMLTQALIDPVQAVKRFKAQASDTTTPDEFVVEFGARLIDLGAFEAALEVSLIAGHRVIGALARGYYSLIRDGDDARAAEALTTIADHGGSIGMRAERGLRLALASLDPRRAVDGADALPLQAREDLFCRLVDLGHLDDASRLEATLSLDPSAALQGRRAMLDLLWHRRPAAAATRFADAFDRTMPDPAAWTLKYHEALAHITAGDAAAAVHTFEALLDETASVPEPILERARTLLADHPVVAAGVDRMMRKRAAARQSGL